MHSNYKDMTIILTWQIYCVTCFDTLVAFCVDILVWTNTNMCMFINNKYKHVPGNFLVGTCRNVSWTHFHHSKILMGRTGSSWQHIFMWIAWPVMMRHALMLEIHLFMGQLHYCPCFQLQLHVCPYFFNFTSLPLFSQSEASPCPYSMKETKRC